MDELALEMNKAAPHLVKMGMDVSVGLVPCGYHDKVDPRYSLVDPRYSQEAIGYCASLGAPVPLPAYSLNNETLVFTVPGKFSEQLRDLVEKFFECCVAPGLTITPPASANNACEMHQVLRWKQKTLTQESQKRMAVVKVQPRFDQVYKALDGTSLITSPADLATLQMGVVDSSSGETVFPTMSHRYSNGKQYNLLLVQVKPKPTSVSPPSTQEEELFDVLEEFDEKTYTTVTTGYELQIEVLGCDITVDNTERLRLLFQLLNAVSQVPQ
jgi:hypothetical protein